MNHNNKYVVGIGEVLWDVLPEGKKIGGAPANFAYHVSQFGLENRVVSAIGDDKLGAEMKQDFASKGLNGMIEKVAYPTGTVQVVLDDEGIPNYTIKENVAWDNNSLYPLLAQTGATDLRRVLRLAGPTQHRFSRETIHAFLDAMPDGEGQYKIFDINLRQGFYTKETICQSLERCNVLKINDEELVTLSRLFGYPASTCKTSAGFYSPSTI